MSASARVVANLDGEVELGRAAGADVALPETVLAGLSAVGSLLRVFAEDGDVLELPRPLDARRVLPVDGLARPALVTRGEADGVPVRRAWMAVDDPAVSRLAPRAACLGLARELDLALPGARVLADLDSLCAHLDQGGARGSPDGRWVLKADWTAAGRGLLLGGPGPPDEALRAAIARRLASHGPLLFEPWLAGVTACGVAGVIEPGGGAVVAPAHVQRVDARGRFRGLLVGAGRVPPEVVGELRHHAERVAERLARFGLRGPFALDALVHERDGQRLLHPLVELNPRLSFGHVAAALHERLGRGAPAGELVFSRARPDGPGELVPLLAPGGVDGWGAWWIRHAGVP